MSINSAITKTEAKDVTLTQHINHNTHITQKYGVSNIAEYLNRLYEKKEKPSKNSQKKNILLKSFETNQQTKTGVNRER